MSANGHLCSFAATVDSSNRTRLVDTVIYHVNCIGNSRAFEAPACCQCSRNRCLACCAYDMYLTRRRIDSRYSGIITAIRDRTEAVLILRCSKRKVRIADLFFNATGQIRLPTQRRSDTTATTCGSYSKCLKCFIVAIITTYLKTIGTRYSIIRNNSIVCRHIICNFGSISRIYLVFLIICSNCYLVSYSDSIGSINQKVCF